MTDPYLGVMISKTQVELHVSLWCFRPVTMEVRIF